MAGTEEKPAADKAPEKASKGRLLDWLDVFAKLLGAAGAWLGLPGLPYVLLLAALLGLAMAASLALQGRRLHAHSPLPFGPCLALAFWLLWMHGGWLMDGDGA